MSVPGGNPPVNPGYAPRPQVRFDAIGEAFRLMQQQMGSWVVASLLVFVVAIIVMTPFYIFVFAAAFAGIRSGNPNAMNAIGFGPRFLSQIAVTIVSYLMLGG